MSFPPSEFLQAQSEFLAAVSVRSALLDMRPDLAERVYVTDSSPVMLSIDAGTGGRVILAKARAGYARRVWMVADSRADAPDSLWNADTTASILAMSALAHLDAATTSRRLPSPWRWNQSESTLLTQLADELDRRGLTPQSVADGNRLYVYRGDAGREIRTWPTTLGRFISLPRPSGQIVITQNGTVGWTVDADVLNSKYRLDPSRILHKSSPVWPGVPVQEVSPNELAAAVEELLKGAETEPSLSTSQRSEDRGDQNSETRLTSQVLAWAYSIGFSDVQWRRSRPNRLELTAGGALIDVRSVGKPASLSEVQRVAGKAMAAGRAPVILDTHGYTRNAATWADDVGLALFMCSERTVQPISQLGWELHLKV